MNIFITSECSEDLASQICIHDINIEELLNNKLENVELDLDYKKWGFVYYCVTPEFSDFFQETQVLRKDPKTIEHRIEIDFNSFQNGTEKGRLDLIIVALKKSVSWMGNKKFKVNEHDQTILIKIIDEVHKELMVL